MAGEIEFVIDTAFGTISCAMNPVDVAGQVIKAAQSLQAATEAAQLCEDIFKDIQETTINRLPVVCELLRLGQLFPDRKGVADLNKALLRCIQSVCDALHAAVTAMYKYLQCNKLSRLRQAAGIEKSVAEMRTRLTNRFHDVDTYIHLATLLSSQQSTQQAQHTAALVQELERKVRELTRVHSADKALVKARAKAALAGQMIEEEEIRVMSPSLTIAGWLGIVTAAVSPSGDKFAVGGHGGSASVWGVASGACMHKLVGHSDIVRAVAWSRDGSRVATGSLDKTAAVWDAATGSRMHELRGHSGHVCSVAWSPDGSVVATASSDRTAAVWDAATGRRVAELRGHSAWVNRAAWSPHGVFVATASDDNTAALWHAPSATRVHELRGHTDQVTSVAWSRDGSRLATASADKTAAVWDAATGSRMHELRGHGDAVTTVAWSPDGSRVATGSADKSAAVRDAATGRRMHELQAHKGAVAMVAWSPNGSRLATGSPTERTAAVWDAATGRRMHELRQHGRQLSSVAWSPGGAHVYTASYDGTVRVYRIN